MKSIFIATSLILNLSLSIFAQKFKVAGLSLRNNDILTEGTKMGVRELEFRNQNNKVNYFLFWKLVTVSSDVYYNGQLHPYYDIAVGNKSLDTVKLKYFNKSTKKSKKMKLICKRELSIFLISNGMYVYELNEMHNKNSR